MPQAPAALSRYREEVEETLRSLLSEGSPPLLYRMMRYHLGWEDEAGRPAAAGGKLLRPSLCLLACQAVGGEWRQALPAAAALELVHNFSLVHDDIQDQDRERRHRPTVWAVWGQPQAINAGDSLLALARLAVLRLADAAVPVHKVVEAARILDERTLEMVEGQCLDLSFEEYLDVGLKAYLEMIAKKTGALFDCALRLGALVGSGQAPTVEAFGRCGRLLGIAFQVRDDMLGVWGSESQTGKPQGADIRRKKKSLPIVYALAKPNRIREELLAILGKEALAEEDVASVLALLAEVGAQDYCQRFAGEKRDEALAHLEAAAVGEAGLAEIRQVAAFLLEREY